MPQEKRLVRKQGAAMDRKAINEIAFMEDVPPYLGFKAAKIHAIDACRLMGLPESTLDKPVKAFNPEGAPYTRLERPFIAAYARRIGITLLRREWDFTGQPIIIADNQQVLRGMRRLSGIIYAYLWWNRARENGDESSLFVRWGAEEPYMDTLLVYGIPASCIDSINTGNSCSASDVVYRKATFEKQSMSCAKRRKKLARTAAAAVRLLWGRLDGKLIRATPSIPSEDVKILLREHPGLVSMVEKCSYINETSGGGLEQVVPVSTAAAIGYLMGICKTNPGADKFNYETWNSAEDFLVALAEGHTGTDPISQLRGYLLQTRAYMRTPEQKDNRVGAIIKAWNLWIDGEYVCNLSDVIPREGEVPRIGGFDCKVSLDA